MAKFDLNDDSVVAVIGSGAGGGTLANELAQKGIDVVSLEAGGRHNPEDFVNDEWASFAICLLVCVGEAPTHSGDYEGREIDWY